MNRRKIKKWSRMARKNPGKLKPFQWRYLMKSWSKSFKEADAVAQHTILSTMMRAFGTIIGQWLQSMRPKPRRGTFPSGGLAVVGEMGPEVIVNEAGNYQLTNDTKSFRKGEKFIVNGEEFTAQ